MKLLIVADAEGCLNYKVGDAGSARAAMCEEIESIIKNLPSNDISITVVDAHADGHNLDSLIGIYPHIKFIHHIWNLHRFDFDKAAIIGMHSKSQSSSPNAHTIRNEILDVKMREESVGELELFINLLNYYSIPVFFVSGEKELAHEIKGHNYITYLYSSTDNSVDGMAKTFFTAFNETAEFGKYNGESIRIKLAANIYYEFIPQTVFPIEQGHLHCDSTLFLFDVLPTLCYALDMAKSFRASAINRIKQFIVMNPKQAAQFKEAENETLIKKADDLSAEDLKALLKRIYAMEEN